MTQKNAIIDFNNICFFNYFILTHFLGHFAYRQLRQDLRKELGLGNQSNFFSNTEFADFVDAVVDVAVDTTILALAQELDKTSYTSTGSSATSMMGNKIDTLKKYYDTATDFVGEVKDAFGAMVGKSDGKMTGIYRKYKKQITK